jgi:hypothetical protein
VRLRPPIRSVATTLAAAAVLVAGANIATYAATGSSLILGHSNNAGTTTTLKNTGRGPALALNSIKSSPPLVVNSSKMVKNLNANTVGGKTAAQLVPATLRYKYGNAGTTFSTSSVPQLYSAKLPKGTYDVNVTGILSDAGSGGSDSYLCVAIDKSALFGSLDYSKVYAFDANDESNSTFGLLNFTNNAQRITGGEVAYGCIFSGSGTFTEERAVQFTFRPVTATDKHGTLIPLTKSAASRLVRR